MLRSLKKFTNYNSNSAPLKKFVRYRCSELYRSGQAKAAGRYNGAHGAHIAKQTPGCVSYSASLDIARGGSIIQCRWPTSETHAAPSPLPHTHIYIYTGAICEGQGANVPTTVTERVGCSMWILQKRVQIHHPSRPFSRSDLNIIDGPEAGCRLLLRAAAPPVSLLHERAYSAVSILLDLNH